MEKVEGMGSGRRWAVDFTDNSTSPSFRDIPDPLGFARFSQDQDDSAVSKQKKDSEANWKAQVLGLKLGRNFLDSIMRWCRFLLQFFLLLFILTAPMSSNSIMMDTKILHVGKELRKETLSLEMGSCLYQLQGLQSNKWYEVKISYPASIPTSFSLQLKKGISDVGMNSGRKLLNTEKLIFETDRLEDINDLGGLYVLVSVQPEGFVAIPGVREIKDVIFNIVCDELLLGIPHEA